MYYLNIPRLNFNISVFEFLFGKVEEIPGTLFGDILVNINSILLTIFGVLYFYQIVMAFVSVFLKGRKYKVTQNYASYIFITCARNEESVIEQLITSIRNLNYPADKIKIHVVADNSQDQTASIARRLGVRVFERENKELVGKSYALDYYFKTVKDEEFPADFAGFIIVDTDNTFEPNYLAEINKARQETNANIIAAYRSSLNLGDSLWSYGSGYSFLRESSLMHKVRSHLNTSAYVSGTSFFISLARIQKIGGWPYHTLIEDIESSAAGLLDGEQIYYVHDAIFYDEQPDNMRDSMRQRLRWVKGLYQVFIRYFGRLFRGIFTGKKKINERFSYFEASLFVTPIPGFTVFWYVIYGILSSVNLIFTHDVHYFIQTYLFTLFDFFFMIYVFTTVLSFIISIVDWKRIKMHPAKKIIYPFFGFFFLITFIPLLLIAPFIKLKWRPVKHKGNPKNLT